MGLPDLNHAGGDQDERNTEPSGELLADPQRGTHIANLGRNFFNQYIGGSE
jgi:hypothetical protein